MNRTALVFTSAAALAVVSLALSWSSRPPRSSEASPAPRLVPTGGTGGNVGIAGPASYSQGGPRFDVVGLPVEQHDDALDVSLRLSRTRWELGQTLYAKVSVRAPDKAATLPTTMVLVLDRSSSMRGEKWAQAQRAANALIAALSPDDELGVVAFDSDVKSLPLTLADAAGKAKLKAFVAELTPNSGTNIGVALSAADRLLGARTGRISSKRVVLVSDGQPTEGLTSPDELASVASELHSRGAAVSAFGVGLDFDQKVMRAIAEEGAGFYAFLEQASGLAAVLEKELELAHHTVARRVTLGVGMPSGLRIVAIAGRRYRHMGENGASFPLPDLGPGHEAQAYVKLEVVAPIPGEAMAVAGAIAPRSDRHHAERITIKAGTGGAPGEGGTVDERLEAEGVRAFASEQVFAATAAFEKGDKAQALSLLDEARKMLGTSSDALAGSEADDLADVRRGWERVNNATEMRRSSMNLTNKKMANFGQNNRY
ncbi:MAG: VWA domain-containing protein [Myxococcaceae bacterium]|nr:VWA domain-containing protein [Myxococcaceae bacterium]